MVTIVRAAFSVHFPELNSLHFIEKTLKCTPKGPIDNKPAVVQMIAWHQAD